MILRLTGTAIPLQSIGFQIWQSSMSGTAENRGGVYPSGEVLQQGKPLPGAFCIAKPAVNEGSHETFRLAVDLEPWQIVATADAEGHDRNDALTHPIPGISVHFQPAGEYKGRTRVTTISNFATYDLDSSIRALGTNGAVLFPIHGDGHSAAPGTTTWFSEFDAPLREIRGFQMAIRKHYWIEFQNVIQGTRGISPSEPTPVPAPTLTEVRFPALLDLDTAKFGEEPSTQSNPSGNPVVAIGATIEYMQTHGYDVMHSHDHLDAIGLKTVPLQPGDWELLSTRELQLRLQTAGVPTSEIRPAAFPADYAFQTREGGMGLMRIVKISPEGTDLQIKRLSR